jgi:hypothetical protein
MIGRQYGTSHPKRTHQKFPLADNTFQVHLDDLLKQQPAITYHMVEIEEFVRVSAAAVSSALLFSR